MTQEVPDISSLHQVSDMLGLGVGGLIAAIIFYVYRKDIRQYTELWKSQSEILTDIVKENTSAITSNTEVVRALHRRLDIEESSRKQ